jgi:hypothetical protein
MKIAVWTLHAAATAGGQMILGHSLCFAFGIAFGLAMPIYAQAPGADATGAIPSVKPAEQGPAVASLKDPIELCEKLAGVEREICVRQARENRERAAGAAIGATPGSGGAVTGGAAAERK